MIVKRVQHKEHDEQQRNGEKNTQRVDDEAGRKCQTKHVHECPPSAPQQLGFASQHEARTRNSSPVPTTEL